MLSQQLMQDRTDVILLLSCGGAVEDSREFRERSGNQSEEEVQPANN